MSRPLSRRTTTVLTVIGLAGATAFVPSTVDAASPSAAPAASTARASEARVVATGLNNPRHLAFQGGSLYVAEAGRGGPQSCHPGPEGGTVCYGNTGSIMKIGARKVRILTGLPSIANKGDGSSALGPSGVITEGKRKIALTIGAGGTPADRAALGASARLIGRVVTATQRGKTWRNPKLKAIADLMRFEARVDPDHQGADSDLTGLLKYRGFYLTTDSGGNDLLRTGGGHPTRVLATFGNRTVTNPFPPPPMVPMQSVPTAVAAGPGGALFVSELTGFPFPKGAARIFRVVPGHAPTVWATGLTNVTDLRWYGGSLYAVQIANDGLLTASGVPVGSLVKVNRGAAATRVGPNLPAPYAVAFRNSTAYVTTCSVCKGIGQVRSIALP